MKTPTTPGARPRKKAAPSKAAGSNKPGKNGAPAEVGDEPAGDEPSAGVGARLRYVRELHGLSQRELARRAGLNHGTIGCIEKETISPSVGSLRKILDSLPMTLSEFFSLDPDTETQVFFQTIQNKLHFAATGRTVLLSLHGPAGGPSNGGLPRTPVLASESTPDPGQTRTRLAVSFCPVFG